MLRWFRQLRAERRAGRAAMCGKELEFVEAAQRIRKREQLAISLGYGSIREMLRHLSRDEVDRRAGIT